VAEGLAVWLYGERVATIANSRGGPRLTYTTDALAKYQLGSPLLSIGLPLTDVPFAPGATKSFLDGLLPEGESRRVVAEEFDIRSNDSFGLIRALGRDCAGAIVILPTNETGAPPTTTLTASPLSEDAIAEKVANLRSAPLGVSSRVRISLAGVQEKLLLTQMPDEVWGEPVDGTPSTHILKPEIRDLRNTVENEAFCMRIAHHLGLVAASIETDTFGDRKVIIVRRFDRIVAENGDVVRIHQEDFCQALSLPPTKKYQEDGGPSLKKIAGVLREFARPDSLQRLLQATFLNILVGNGDAHGKNFSILHHRDGSIQLAPQYDVMSTLFYRDDRLAMYIDDMRRTQGVSRIRLTNEARSWGMRQQSIDSVIDELVERTPTALERARDETPGVPDELLAVCDQQMDVFAQ
jgi:serine/threonine-protein kinase HipA